MVIVIYDMIQKITLPCSKKDTTTQHTANEVITHKTSQHKEVGHSLKLKQR